MRVAVGLNEEERWSFRFKILINLSKLKAALWSF